MPYGLWVGYITKRALQVAPLTDPRWPPTGPWIDSCKSMLSLSMVLSWQEAFGMPDF